MPISPAALSPEKFAPFSVYSTSYKTVNEHPIGVDVLVPKSLKSGSGKSPLIVRFHGGYLVSTFIQTLAAELLFLRVGFKSMDD